MMQIRRAVKGRQKLRMGLIGPTGSGKTKTALLFADALVAGTDLRVGVIDTERESSELYADAHDFDVIQLTDSHDPRQYIEALRSFAEAGGYGVVVVDSLSHAWMGRGGIQEQLDNYAKKHRGDSFGGWRELTPLHNQFVDALLAAPFHVIGTLRAKMEYVVEKDSAGKTNIKKVGLAPVQRDGMEYEFTVVCDLDVDHNLMVGKTRCPVVDGMVVNRPDGRFAKILRDWIESGVERPAPVLPAATEPVQDAHERNGAAPKEERATHGQVTLIATMVKSHVITDKERDPILRKISEGTFTKERAKECIDWLQTEITARKAVETAEAAETQESLV
jgi:hypothetical protein